MHIDTTTLGGPLAPPRSEPLVVAAGHPSLDGAIDRLVGRLRDTTPTEHQRALDAVIGPADRRTVALRLAVVAGGEVHGIACVGVDGDVNLAVDAGDEGRHARLALLEAVAQSSLTTFPVRFSPGDPRATMPRSSTERHR